MISIEKVVISLIFMASSYVFCENYTENKLPTILFAIFARNKEHTLPYYLTYMERLDYPKDRISLWIRSDHNEDNTLEILKNWLSSVRGKYHSISTELLSTPPERHNDETGPTHWSPKRFTHMIQLREEALRAARYIWADYIWFIDCDVFLTNNQTLKELIQLNKTVSAPMLKSDGMYSNFWCGMTEDYYYIRTDEYKPTLTRSRMGCFEVPMIHSAVLIDLRKKSSSNLTFIPENIPNYEGPHDDIISFAISANKTGVPLNICNQEIYGYILVPLDLNDSLEDDILQLTNIKLEVLVDGTGLQVNDQFKDYIYYPEEDTLAFDRIYMINLARRPKRRERMLQSFKELGLRVTTVPAVDGKLLNETTLNRLGIQAMPEYEDPYHKRPLTMGEIGCFLSHYKIWQQVIEHGYTQVMVLEDDIRFEPYFRLKVNEMMAEIERLELVWDLVYLGRKRLHESEEPWVPGSRYLVEAGYSYWTLGYLLTQQGAHKLLRAKPLDNLLPVDEYLPILFDKHPQESWKTHFPQRDLIAFSAAPLLVFPTHYTGEKGYVSDTEDSLIVNNVDAAGKPLKQEL